MNSIKVSNRMDTIFMNSKKAKHLNLINNYSILQVK